MSESRWVQTNKNQGPDELNYGSEFTIMPLISQPKRKDKYKKPKAYVFNAW